MDSYSEQPKQNDLMDFAKGGAQSSGAESGGADSGGYTDDAYEAPPRTPYPNELLAQIFTQLASTGVPEAKIEKFRKEYGEQLLQLFQAFEFSQGLADIGVTMGGRNPTWLRIAGGLGSVAVLTFIHRPELVGRWLKAIRREKQYKEPSDLGPEDAPEDW